MLLTVAALVLATDAATPTTATPIATARNKAERSKNRFIAYSLVRVRGAREGLNPLLGLALP
jgi:hypothetical protein